MKSVESRVYAFRFAEDFMLIYPFYALMFVDNGLSNAQISVLFFVWSATTVFEVPSGVLADKFDRRYILAIGQLLVAFGFTSWLVFDHFWGFLVGFALWGIAGTMSSGTFEALVYDELKSRNIEHTYAKVNGRAEGFALVAILLSTLVASLTPNNEYAIPLIASVAVSIVAGFIALSLPKAAPIEGVADTEYLAVLKQGIATTIRAPRLLRAIVPAALALSVFGTFDEYAPLYLDKIDLANSTVAVVFAAVSVICAIGAFLAHRAERLSERSTVLAMIVSGALLVIAGLVQDRSGIVLFGIFFFMMKVVEVVTSARVQHAIVAPMRATVTSVSSFLSEMMAVVIYVIFAVAPNNDVFFGFVVSGALLCIISCVLVLRTARAH